MALYTDSTGTLTHSSCFHWITSTASWLLSYSPFDGTHTHMHACMHTEAKVPKTWPDDVLFTWVPAQVEEEWLSGMIHLVMGRDSLYLLPWAKVHPLTHICTHAHTYTHTHMHRHRGIHTHTHAHIHTHRGTHTHTHRGTHTHTHTQKGTHAHTHRGTQKHTHPYIHEVHSHTHTHTHTCKY